MFPTLYVVREGDTLSGIALHFYGNGTETYWRRIYNANRAVVGNDPNCIRPGECLRIPFPACLPCEYVVKAGDTGQKVFESQHGVGSGWELWCTTYDDRRQGR